ncbi:MAG: tetratricopeptide repeat protein [Roseiflexus sp.]|nr:tetratricopeptide repeat protein [Roseiflexus sp.]
MTVSNRFNNVLCALPVFDAQATTRRLAGWRDDLLSLLASFQPEPFSRPAYQKLNICSSTQSYRSNTTLIVVAPYQSPDGVDRSDIHRKIIQTLRAEYRALQREANMPALNLRIVEAPRALDGEDCSAARALGQQVGAALVVWGRVCNAQVTTWILNLSQSDTVIILNETEHTRLAAPQAFTRYVAGDAQEMAMYASFSILGDAYSNAGEYSAAMCMLERAIAHGHTTASPESAAQTFFRLGWLYQTSRNSLAQAVAAYTRAIALNPNNPIAYYNRGIACAEQGDLARAIADYTRAIDLDPKYAVAYYNRALARCKQGDLVGAIADYDNVLLLDPGDARACASRGMARYSQGDLDGAVADFDRALALYPNIAIAYINRGIVRSLRGDRWGARADFECARAATRDPQLQEWLDAQISELR